MPRLRGLLPSTRRIENEELELAQSQAMARLADLGERLLAAPAEVPSAADPLPHLVQDLADDDPERSSAPGIPRPPIVVEGSAEVATDRATGEVAPLDIMARLREDLREDGLQRSIDARLVPAVGRAPTGASGISLAPDVSTDQVQDPANDDAVPASAADDSTSPVLGEQDADLVADGPVDGAEVWISELAPSLDDVAEEPVVDAVAPALPRSAVGNSDPSRKSSSPGRQGRFPATRTAEGKTGSEPVSTAFCPYCAQPVLSEPVSSQRCARCRQRFIVKRVDGRAIYLTEAALPIFVAERRRVAASARLTRERDRWLRLATAAGSPPQSLARLAAARLSEEVVDAARNLYLTTVDRVYRAAKREHDWETASRSRREKATVLYRGAGSPVPPPVDFVAMFREGVVAELRGIAEISREAELVGAACCEVCRIDDGLITRIAQELRMPRLPHEGCPRGLCRCHWDIADRDRTTMRKYLRRRTRTQSRGDTDRPAQTV